MKDLFEQKRGQVSLGNAPSIVITLVIIAIVLGLGATVLANFQSNLTANSIAANVTGDGLSGLDTFSGFQTTIAIVVVAAVVLGLVGLIAFARR